MAHAWKEWKIDLFLYSQLESRVVGSGGGCSVYVSLGMLVCATSEDEEMLDWSYRRSYLILFF